MALGWPGAGLAQTWQGDTSSAWEMGSNWRFFSPSPITGVRVPGVDAPNSNPILSSNRLVFSVDIESGGDLTVDGAGYLRTNSIGPLAGDINVEDGVLRLSNGGQVRSLGGVGIGDDGELDVNYGSRVFADVESSGTLSNAGNVYGDVTITGGSAENAGNFLSDLSVDDGVLDNSGAVAGLVGVGAAGELNNLAGGRLNGGLTTAGTTTNSGVVTGQTTVNGGTLANQDNGLLNGPVTIYGGELINQDAASINGDVSVRTDGTLTNESIVDGDVRNYGIVDNSGSITGRLIVYGGGVADNDGAVDGITIVGAAGELNNLAGGRLNGGLTTAGATTNSGVVTGQTTVNGGTLANQDNGLLNGPVTIYGGELINQDTASINGDVSVRTDGTLTNESIVDGDVRNYGTVDNSGSITGRLIVYGGGVADNDGAVDGITIVGAAGELNNLAGGRLNGGLTTAGATTNSGVVTGQTTVNGGTLANQDNGLLNGPVTIYGGELINQDAASINGDVSVRTDGTLTNESIVDGDVRNYGIVDNSGSITGRLIVYGGGVADNDGTVDGITIVGAAGELNNLAGGRLNGGLTTAGATTNSGVVTGQTTVNGGTLTNQNNGRLNGPATVNGGELVNQDTARINGDVGVEAAGTLTNQSVINGDVTSRGAVDNSGAINGAFNIESGLADNSGTVTGLTTIGGSVDLTNNAGGRLIGGVDIIDGSLTNEVAAYVAGGVDVSSAGALTNRGDISGDVTSRGAVDNSGTINGAFNIESGLADNSGTVTGLTTIGGGVDLTNNAGGRLIGGVDIVDGSLTNEVAAYVAGGVDVSSAGALTNRGDISGDVTSRGAVDSSGSITGRLGVLDGVTNNSGAVGGLATVGTSGELNNLAGGQLNGGLTTAGTTINSGSVTGQTTVAAGTLTNQDNGRLNGPVRIDGGELTNQDMARINGDVSLGAAGTLTNRNVVDGDVTSRGAVDNSGSITGRLGVLDGVTNNSGAVGGLATVGTSGELNNLAGGQLNGGLTTAGTTINSGSVTGQTTVAAGTLTNQGDGRLNGPVRIDGGELTNQDMARINGDVSLGAAGTLTNRSVVDGDVTSRGAVDNSGSITGRLGVLDGVTNNSGAVGGLATVGTSGELNNLAGGQLNGGLTTAGTTINSGSVTGQTTVAAGTLTNQDNGRLNGPVRIDGGELTNQDTALINGDVTVGTSGELTNRSTIDGDVESDGTVDNSGSIAGLLTNFGSLTSTGVIGGGLFNANEARVRGIVNGLIDNRDQFTLTGNLTGNGIFSNSGAFTSNSLSGFTLGGVTLFDNKGDMEIAGALTLATNVVNSGAIDLSKLKSDVNDVLTVNGNLSGSGDYIIDLVLPSNDNPMQVGSDKIVVNGDFTGVGEVDFRGVDPLANRLHRAIIIFDVSGSSLGSELTTDDLPPDSGLIQHRFQKIGQDWAVTANVNPAAGGIAGSITLVNSMVGTVVNRPGSAFVGGLAYETKPNECGLGAWSRATGGYAQASGRTEGGFEPTTTDVDGYFGGYQGGGDLQCFSLGQTGWDIAAGGFGGYNYGQVSQVVEQNDVDIMFNQLYGGTYISAAKGSFVAELQGRFDYIDYRLESPELSLDDRAPGLRTSVSAAASYGLKVGEFSLTPTVGASVSNNQIRDLEFITGHKLEFDDNWTVTGFAGATVARAFLNADKTAAYQPFVTGTVYSDFGATADSTFVDPVETTAQHLTSEGIGTFGEVSAGLNYIKILPDNAMLGMRQLNATVRGDFKFSDRMLSAGGTAQLRLQF